MSIEPGRTTGTAQDATALKSLTAALRRLAEGSSLEEALGAIADAAAAATAAEVAVVRVLDETGRSLEARAVSASSTSVAAELQGSRMATSADGDALRSTGHRLGLGVALGLPIALRDRELGRLELFRRAEPFTAAEESLGRLAAEHAAVALASLGGNGKGAPPLPARDLLRLGGDALATGLDEQRTAEEIARLAAQASARGRRRPGDRAALPGPHARDRDRADRGAAGRRAARRLSARARRRASARGRWPRTRGAAYPCRRASDRPRSRTTRTRGDADRRREVRFPPGLSSRAAHRNRDRGRRRVAPSRPRGLDRPARRLPAQRAHPDAGRARAGDCARRAARCRRPERAPPRAGETARGRATRGARGGAAGVPDAALPLRDLADICPEPLVGDDTRGARADVRRAARARRSRDPDARRARRGTRHAGPARS